MAVILQFPQSPRKRLTGLSIYFSRSSDPSALRAIVHGLITRFLGWNETRGLTTRLVRRSRRHVVHGNARGLRALRQALGNYCGTEITVKRRVRKAA